MHGLDFITSVYDHEPPDFRTTWQHFLRSRNKPAFCNLQALIIRAIVVSNTNHPTIDDTAPFWWLLLHLDMHIFAPSTRKQRSDSSIQNTIRNCIDAAFSGDIAYLFNSAMNVKRLTRNTRPAYIGKNRRQPTTINIAQPSHLHVPPNMLQQSAPTTFHTSINYTPNQFPLETININRSHQPHHLSHSPSQATSAKPSSTRPKTKEQE